MVRGDALFYVFGLAGISPADGTRCDDGGFGQLHLDPLLPALGLFYYL